MMTDKDIIEKCKELAESARLKGNPGVGCVITCADRIIATAEESSKSEGDITLHAEMKALKIAAREMQTSDLSGCTLYSTHEPCVMCSYAIRFHRVSKIVYLHTVDYFGGISSHFPVLTTSEVPSHWSKPPEVIQYKPE